MNRISIILLLICCIIGGQLGCSNSATSQVDGSLKPALQDFAQFLESIKGDGMKPPKKMAEFLPMEPMAPIASEYLQDGRMIYIWGAGLDKAGQKIIAYDKAVESTGGYVLLEDGTVKEMSSSEFASATKASPSK